MSDTASRSPSPGQLWLPTPAPGECNFPATALPEKHDPQCPKAPNEASSHELTWRKHRVTPMERTPLTLPWAGSRAQGRTVVQPKEPCFSVSSLPSRDLEETPKASAS